MFIYGKLFNRSLSRTSDPACDRVNLVSRTRRIYNSYERYGRYLLREEFSPKIQYIFHDGSQKERIFLYHPYQVWCFGNTCHSCRRLNPTPRQRSTKHTRKRKILKFDYEWK